MTIHNASFMIEREREKEFLDWLRVELSRRFDLSQPEGPRNARLSAMRRAAGVDYSHAEAQTVAFQVEFDTTKLAMEWSSDKFANLAALFEEHFGPNAMVFTSLFEALPL